MNAGIFIKTYKGDAEWLKYCLKSIRKFCKGYGQVVVVSEDYRQILPIVQKYDCNFAPVPECKGDGYIWQQVIKLEADRYMLPEIDHVVYVDSDCVFHRENTPEFWFKDGKPIMLMTPYASLPPPPAMPWKQITEEIVGFECPFETMRRHPMVIPTHILGSIREHIRITHSQSWRSYLMSRPLRSCSEFNIIGSYILKFCPEIVTAINTDTDPLPENVLKQFWSWGGIKPEIKAEIERMLK